MLTEGRFEEVLNSNTPWLCVACQTCQVRCPSQLLISDGFFPALRSAVMAESKPTYEPRNQEISRKLARILQAAEVDYAILYEAERNTGNDARRAGEEGLFELLREKNPAALQKARFNNLRSTDPPVYNTLKNEYPELNHGRHAMLHDTDLRAEAVGLTEQAAKSAPVEKAA
jgi:Fe-S oxidoreductase